LDECHCGLPRDDLLKQAAELLEIPDPILLDALGLELAEGTLIAARLEERGFSHETIGGGMLSA
jgi:exodeoxyribonuclease V alpha subunit